MTDQPNPIIDRDSEWRDVSFTGLPAGWLNGYEQLNGRVHAHPCPGVLTQELVKKWVVYLDGTYIESNLGDGDFTPRTRTVFAAACELRPPVGDRFAKFPSLVPADDASGPSGTYIGTLTVDDAEANWGCWS